MGNGTQSPTAISGGDGYDQLTINAHYPYWSVISGFEEISADGTGVIPDHIGQAGTTLKFSYVNYGDIDFSAETDANIEINTNTRTREAEDDTGNDTLIGGALDDIINSLAGNDTVTGGAGNDTINLGLGDDIVTGGAGDDTIDGGLGADIAIFSGNQSDYTITETGYAKYQLSLIHI